MTRHLQILLCIHIRLYCTEYNNTQIRTPYIKVQILFEMISPLTIRKSIRIVNSP